MSKPAVIAIFDIGKTNKKLFFLDEQYKICYEQSTILPEIVDEDGDPCENLDQLIDWIKDSLQADTAEAYDIRAINFSAYGASFVYLDQNGKSLTPLYNYLKRYPAELSAAFYESYGGADHFSMLTASPVLGSLNAGMQLYRLKKLQPAIFQQLKYALHLPQFISYLITGKFFSDITSIGCHTNLWDFSRQQYHAWVYRECIQDKLAPLFPASFTNPAMIAGKLCRAGIGLHDSSAALIPYLRHFPEPFILISTGTWCISLNPFNQQPLTAVELRQDCLCYLSFEGKPVKASRLFAGQRHDQEVKALALRFQEADDYYKEVEFDAGIIGDLRAERGVRKDVGYKEAYHQLMLDIMSEQERALRLVMDGSSVKRIFVDGGFGKNLLYMHLLADAFPELSVFAASVPQATAVGAALAIHGSWNSKPVPEDLVDLKFYAPSGSRAGE